MLRYLQQALAFLNFLDRHGNLSITNLAVIAFSIKILTLPEIDIAALVTFMTVVVNYNVKRFVVSKAKPS